MRKLCTLVGVAYRYSAGVITRSRHECLLKLFECQLGQSLGVLFDPDVNLSRGFRHSDEFKARQNVTYVYLIFVLSFKYKVCVEEIEIRQVGHFLSQLFRSVIFAYCIDNHSCL